MTLTKRTDVPTMYAEEVVYQADDGTLAVVMIRQADTEPGRLQLNIDCWEVDASGVPTGLTAPRATHSQTLASIAPGAGLGTLPEIIAARTDDAVTALLEQKRLASDIATVPIRWLAPPTAPPIDMAHPLEEPAVAGSSSDSAPG